MKRIIAFALVICMCAVYAPTSLSAGEYFDPETLTIKNLDTVGGKIFSLDKEREFSESSYTFSDGDYDLFIEGNISNIFSIEYYDTNLSSVTMKPRWREDQIADDGDIDSISVVQGGISGLHGGASYEYRLVGETTWKRFTTLISGAYEHLDIDRINDVVIELRRSADVADFRPASYPIEIQCIGKVEDKEEEEDDDELKLNFSTLTVSGLEPGMTVRASSKSHTYSFTASILNDTIVSTVIPNEEYDLLFGSDDIKAVMLRVFHHNDPVNPVYSITLTPRPETPIVLDLTYDELPWVASGLEPGKRYQHPYIYNDDLWTDFVADADGKAELELVDRSRTYTVPIRVASGETHPPSYATQVSIQEFIPEKHNYISVEMDEGLIDFSMALREFGYSAKFEYSNSSKPGRWYSVSLKKRERDDDDKEVAKFSKFVPKTGVSTIEFRVKAAKGQPANPVFDVIKVAARPVLETKANKLSVFYTAEEEGSMDVVAKIVNATPFMYYADEREKDEGKWDYNWESWDADIPPSEQIFDLPDIKSAKLYLSILQADVLDSRARGLYGAYVPASKIKSLSIRSLAKAPKPTVKSNSITIKKGMEYWLSTNNDGSTLVESAPFVINGTPTVEIVKNDKGKETGRKYSIISTDPAFTPGTTTTIYFRKAVPAKRLGKSPPSNIQTITVTCP